MIVKNTVLKYRPVYIALGMIGVFSTCAHAEMSMSSAERIADIAPVNFNITGYVIDGSNQLSTEQIDAATRPYIGVDKNFSDVERARAAIEAAYITQGLSAIQLTLPEQKLQNGIVHFHVIESHYGKITVTDNKFHSENNVLNALPSLRSGKMPNAELISKELKLANENPSRQAEVVLRQGNGENEVDAIVHVRDSKPGVFNVTLDNTGSPETGRTRFGIAYRNANLFDADHLASLQYMTSVENPNRVQVIGAGYTIPLYKYGSSLAFFAGYSNVNSVVAGLDNFKGGGTLLSGRYNYQFKRIGKMDQRVSLGLDWRNFNRIEQVTPFPVVLYNEIAILPANLTYTAEGKFDYSSLNLNLSFSQNIPGVNNGRKQDFVAYDPGNTLKPDANFKVIRYGAVFSQSVANDWLFKTSVNGQHSSDTLILGEQFRLGGAEGVRGFSEGSESGNSGSRISLEGYTPHFSKNHLMARALVFFDAGQVNATILSPKSSISSTGLGFRASLSERVNLSADLARIVNSGVDPLQRVGDWRAHLSLTSSF